MFLSEIELGRISDFCPWTLGPKVQCQLHQPQVDNFPWHRPSRSPGLAGWSLRDAIGCRLSDRCKQCWPWQAGIVEREACSWCPPTSRCRWPRWGPSLAASWPRRSWPQAAALPQRQGPRNSETGPRLTSTWRGGPPQPPPWCWSRSGWWLAECSLFPLYNQPVEGDFSYRGWSNRTELCLLWNLQWKKVLIL